MLHLKSWRFNLRNYDIHFVFFSVFVYISRINFGGGFLMKPGSFGGSNWDVSRRCLGPSTKHRTNFFPNKKRMRERESGNVRCGVKAAEYDRGLFIIIVKMFVVNDVLYVSRGAVKMSRTCKTINPLTPNHSHSLYLSFAFIRSIQHIFMEYKC